MNEPELMEIEHRVRTDQVRALPPLLSHSHLRWDHLCQRSQQLMTRFAVNRRVIVFGAPVPDERGPGLSLRTGRGGVVLATPHLVPELLQDPAARNAALKRIVDRFILEHDLQDHVAWYDNPLGLAHTAHLAPRLTVYDCVEDPSHSKGDPVRRAALEAALLRRADLVITCGQTGYEAKALHHPRVHRLPSGVDVRHFRRARSPLPVPADQRIIPRPRIGYVGVIDDRVDFALIEQVAAANPGFQLILLGPLVNIDPAALPRLQNIHYLGAKAYKELPAYLAGWDVAMLPLRRQGTGAAVANKTAELLSAGRPIVATSVRDVARPYGKDGLVRLADEPSDFEAAIHAALAEDLRELRARADRTLARMTWAALARQLSALMEDRICALEAPDGVRNGEPDGATTCATA
jgi:glycosyltransferase involved in cell wall biosynthesis